MRKSRGRSMAWVAVHVRSPRLSCCSHARVPSRMCHTWPCRTSSLSVRGVDVSPALSLRFSVIYKNIDVIHAIFKLSNQNSSVLLLLFYLVYSRNTREIRMLPTLFSCLYLSMMFSHFFFTETSWSVPKPIASAIFLKDGNLC